MTKSWIEGEFVMSDFLYFVCWFGCVFTSALCVAGLAGDYWYSESAAMSLLLPLCLSLMLGSFLFLGFWKLRVEWRSYASLAQGGLMARVSQANNVATRNADLRPSQYPLD